MLVRDADETFPSFQEFLYSSLDWDIHLVMIMVFFFFERLLSEQLKSDQWSMLSIFLTYMVERILRKLRTDWGESNLTK
jgi:hypothetical protein